MINWYKYCGKLNWNILQHKKTALTKVLLLLAYNRVKEKRLNCVLTQKIIKKECKQMMLI